MNYTKISRNIYSYTRANGKKVYRGRKFAGGKMYSKTFNTLKDCKNWLMTFTTKRATTKRATAKRTR